MKVEIGVPFHEATTSKSCQQNAFCGIGSTRMSLQSKEILELRHSFQLESSRAPPRALINAALSRRASRTPPSVDSRGLAGLQRSRRALRAAELTCLLESLPPCFVVRAPPCATCWRAASASASGLSEPPCSTRGLAGLRHRRVPPRFAFALSELSRAQGRNALPDRKEGLSP